MTHDIIQLLAVLDSIAGSVAGWRCLLEPQPHVVCVCCYYATLNAYCTSGMQATYNVVVPSNPWTWLHCHRHSIQHASYFCERREDADNTAL